MNILFLATVYRHLTDFHLPYIKHLQSKGFKVLAAGSEDLDSREILRSNNVECIDLDLSRNPVDFGNFNAISNLQKIIKINNINLIHVHTPIAAAVARVALKKEFKTKIIYTAHGFHFYQGAPLKNWLIYYPIERLLTSKTDFLIVINNEDYKISKNLGYRNNVKLINGVGISPPENLFNNKFEKNIYLDENEIPKDRKNVIYVAELNDNKNHIFLLKNWRKICSNHPKLNLLIVGFGKNEEQLKKFVSDNELNNVYFLGYRKDVSKLLEISDVICLLSQREGLPKSIMEGMSHGLPAIVTRTRGLTDLIEDEINGRIVELNDNNKLIEAFDFVLCEKKHAELSKNSLLISEKFFLSNIIKEYEYVYKLFLKKEEFQ